MPLGVENDARAGRQHLRLPMPDPRAVQALAMALSKLPGGIARGSRVQGRWERSLTFPSADRAFAAALHLPQPVREAQGDLVEFFDPLVVVEGTVTMRLFGQRSLQARIEHDCGCVPVHRCVVLEALNIG